MKKSHRVIAVTTLSIAGLAFGFQFLQAKHLNVNSAAPIVAKPGTVPVAVDSGVENADKLQGSRDSIQNMLDQIIADAIQRGTLNLSTLTAAQLALLPDKFKARSAPGDTHGVATTNALSEDELEEIEMRATANIAPQEPQKPDCPEPGHLPESWNNEYNKSILRARGCTL